MASKHQDDGDGYEHDSEEEDAQSSLDEEASNESEAVSEHETEMESDESVWKYYADVAWKNALEDTNSMLHNVDDVNDIEEKVKKEWLKTMDKHFVDAYRSDLLHYIDLKDDSVHNSVMLTKKKMMREFNMDSE